MPPADAPLGGARVEKRRWCGGQGAQPIGQEFSDWRDKNLKQPLSVSEFLQQGPDSVPEIGAGPGSARHRG